MKSNHLKIIFWILVPESWTNLHFLASESSLLLRHTHTQRLIIHQKWLLCDWIQVHVNSPFVPGKEYPPQHSSPICRGQHHLEDALTLQEQSDVMSLYFSPFNNQVTVAAATVASWLPTPTPLREAWVARVPDRELEKAWEGGGEF